MSDTEACRWEYENDCQRRIDDDHARKARDLTEADIYDEALREAQRIHHYRRSEALKDEIRRRRDRDWH